MKILMCTIACFLFLPTIASADEVENTNFKPAIASDAYSIERTPVRRLIKAWIRTHCSILTWKWEKPCRRDGFVHARGTIEGMTQLIYAEFLPYYKKNHEAYGLPRLNMSWQEFFDKAFDYERENRNEDLSVSLLTTMLIGFLEKADEQSSPDCPQRNFCQ